MTTTVAYSTYEFRLRQKGESAKVGLGEQRAKMAASVLQLRAELASRFDIPVGVREKPQTASIPTGIAAVDSLLGGGVPKGTLTEICGGVSSGRTVVMFSLLAQATRAGECTAWIDADGRFDPASAVSSGVDLARLLWVNCGGVAEHALKSADLVIQAGGFGLVVLDLGDTPVREARRIPLASWFRLRHAVERGGTALVAVEREICARSCSTLQLELKRRSGLWSQKRLRGVVVQGESRKHFRATTVEFEAER